MTDSNKFYLNLKTCTNKIPKLDDKFTSSFSLKEHYFRSKMTIMILFDSILLVLLNKNKTEYTKK